MGIILDENVIDFDNIINNVATDDNCTNPSGHCFGSDGGTGIPENLKVPIGRGGNFEIWQLNKQKTEILKKMQFLRCQYCLKYSFKYEI